MIGLIASADGKRIVRGEKTGPIGKAEVLGRQLAQELAWPREVPLAVEVRHLDWFNEPQHSALNALLQAHHVGRVIIDTRPIRTLSGAKIDPGTMQVQVEAAQERKPDEPVLPVRTASFAFVRYIGHPDVAANAPLLDAWAGQMAVWLKEGATVYAFCHSPDQTYAPPICRELH